MSGYVFGAATLAVGVFFGGAEMLRRARKDWTAKARTDAELLAAVDANTAATRENTDQLGRQSRRIERHEERLTALERAERKPAG